MLLPDLQATQALAIRLAAQARPGDALLLSGPLGAGKSALARAFLRALTGEPMLEVPSPSFTLVQSYALPGGRHAHHFDLYRLTGAADLRELGWEDAQADIVIVEWPERLGVLAPAHALGIALRVIDEDAREATLTGWEERA